MQSQKNASPTRVTHQPPSLIQALMDTPSLANITSKPYAPTQAVLVLSGRADTTPVTVVLALLQQIQTTPTDRQTAHKGGVSHTDKL